MGGMNLRLVAISCERRGQRMRLEEAHELVVGKIVRRAVVAFNPKVTVGQDGQRLEEALSWPRARLSSLPNDDRIKDAIPKPRNCLEKRNSLDLLLSRSAVARENFVDLVVCAVEISSLQRRLGSEEPVSRLGFTGNSA